MKRPRQHVLEDESRNALRSFLPSEWIIRDVKPDYGIDMEVEIVEDEKVTNKVFWLQLKATDSLKSRQKKIVYKTETEHLKFWEGFRLPVLILYYFKPKNVFYSLFAQKYIREILSMENPDWRNQKYTTMRFPLDSKLDDIKNLKSIADEGYFYIMEQQLNEKQRIEVGTQIAYYWLNGIPKSDNQELKDNMSRALQYELDNKYAYAVKEYETILNELTISPTEKMSVFSCLGGAYYYLSNHDKALENFKSVLRLTEKGNKNDALKGKSVTLGNIGVIYSFRGDLEKALKCHKDALKICREISEKEGEAPHLTNLGSVYQSKGKLNDALKFYKDAQKINRKIGCKQGEAEDLCGIESIYSEKGELGKALKYLSQMLTICSEIGYSRGKIKALCGFGSFYFDKDDIKRALKYLKNALRISRDIGYKVGEAILLGNLGQIYTTKGNFDKAIEYHNDALKINEDLGYKKGIIYELNNIGFTYCEKNDLRKALKYCKTALSKSKRTGYKYEETLNLIHIGIIYIKKEQWDRALKYLKEALIVSRKAGFKKLEAAALGNIGLIYKAKGKLDTALKYLKSALKILDKHKLVYGRDIIQNAIESITNKSVRR